MSTPKNINLYVTKDMEPEFIGQMMDGIEDRLEAAHAAIPGITDVPGSEEDPTILTGELYDSIAGHLRSTIHNWENDENAQHRRDTAVKYLRGMGFPRDTAPMVLQTIMEILSGCVENVEEEEDVPHCIKMKMMHVTQKDEVIPETPVHEFEKEFPDAPSSSDVAAMLRTMVESNNISSNCALHVDVTEMVNGVISDLYTILIAVNTITRQEPVIGKDADGNDIFAVDWSHSGFRFRKL